MHAARDTVQRTVRNSTMLMYLAVGKLAGSGIQYPSVIQQMRTGHGGRNLSSRAQRCWTWQTLLSLPACLHEPTY
jgi:hypothetical protein